MTKLRPDVASVCAMLELEPEYLSSLFRFDASRLLHSAAEEATAGEREDRNFYLGRAAHLLLLVDVLDEEAEYRKNDEAKADTGATPSAKGLRDPEPTSHSSSGGNVAASIAGWVENVTL